MLDKKIIMAGIAVLSIILVLMLSSGKLSNISNLNLTEVYCEGLTCEVNETETIESPTTVIGEETQQEEKTIEILYWYSDCIPHNYTENIERLFNTTDYYINAGNIFLTTAFFSYEEISNVEANYTIDTLAIDYVGSPYSSSERYLKVDIHEYPGENLTSNESVCLRIWSMEIRNIPEIVKYMHLTHFRHWGEATYKSEKTIEIKIS